MKFGSETPTPITSTFTFSPVNLTTLGATMQVDPTAGTVRTLTTDGRSLAHPLTAAGLDLAVRDAVQHAPVGEAYSGAIDFLLRKPALARHGRGSLVR